jgi:hypothetical protein
MWTAFRAPIDNKWTIEGVKDLPEISAMDAAAPEKVNIRTRSCVDRLVGTLLTSQL